MTSIGVRELRQDASTWLQRAEAGEVIVVTRHGRPVAQLGPVAELTGLAKLQAEGRMSVPTRSLADVLEEFPPLPAREGESLTDVVLRRRNEERY